MNSLQQNANHIEIWENLRNVFPHPYLQKDAENWIEICKMAHEINDMAICLPNDTAIGGIGLIPGQDVSSHCAEIGYWVGKKYWGNRIATTALALWIEYIFENRIFKRLEARVFSDNEASEAVLKRNGFEYEGRLRKRIIKNGIYKDEIVYGLLKENYTMQQH